MKYLPQWEPNDGSGKGLPNFTPPLPVFGVSSIGATMQVTLLGSSYQLTKDQSNPLFYENTSVGITAQLSAAPLNDKNVQEYVRVTVSMPSAGIVNCAYDCDETSASSNSFENSTPGLVATSPSLNPGTVDSLTLKFYDDNFTTDFQLTETGVNTNTFSGNGLTAKVISMSGGVLNLAVSSTPRGLSNTVLRLSDSGGEYRNFDPPTPTSLPKEDVSEYAAFYIQVPVNLAPQGEQPKIKLNAKVNGQEEEFAEVNLVSTGENNWRSEKVLILSSLDAETSEMTSQDQNETQVLRLPENAEMNWKDGGGTVTIEYGGGTVEVPAQANGIVLQSLDFWTKFGQGLNPENFIRKPFQEMGYTMYKDYHAPRDKTVNDYVKGKQIWYSMSHGATQDGTPQTEFGALKFKDGFIKASDLSSLELNYRLVVVDGCVSAQTSTLSEQDAMSNGALLDGPREFAETFGQNAAYVGWGWTMTPIGAQTWSSEFINNLKGGKTVQEAFDKFHADNDGPKPAAKLLKLYRNGANIIDIKARPNATTAEN